MTTMTQADLERIVEQRLSPLYISVHATEEQTRKYLLGIKHDDGLLEKIADLTEKGITLHTQIVLCPGINDGEFFDRTVNDLKKFYPGVKSVAVVPVGLTQHRRNLPELRIHSVDELKGMIDYTNEFRTQLMKELGVRFIYLADEFFIKAETDLPPAEYYDEFYQIENGVGEFRDMIDRFKEELPNIIKTGFERPIKITWVSGELAAEPLDKFIIKPLRNISNLEIDLVPIKNNFYGSSVHVSGLLVGEDIYDQLKNHSLGDLILLPPRVLNSDGLLLDDWTPAEISEKLGTPVHVYTEPLEQLPEVIQQCLRYLPITNNSEVSDKNG
jgi:putative radical SAM enzyme (TIGR03279 family)